MTKPVMIRNFFEKISTASVVKAPQAAAEVTPAPVVIPTKLPELAIEIPTYTRHNDAYPPLSTSNSAANRALANDFGVGLPPMSRSLS